MCKKVKLANLKMKEKSIDQQEVQEQSSETKYTEITADPPRPGHIVNRDNRYLRIMEAKQDIISPSVFSASMLTPSIPQSLSPSDKLLSDHHPINMAPVTDDKFFCGDYSAGEKPHIWFRCLEGKFNKDTKLVTKLYRFAKGLKPARPAEIWYHNLTAPQVG
jgi:hypothetical protein